MTLAMFFCSFVYVGGSGVDVDEEVDVVVGAATGFRSASVLANVAAV
jgi:hypothetical protein